MPTTEIGTLNENGETNIDSYSLCFPYYIAGKEYYAMVLCCRNSSNTARNILRTGKCSINFTPYHQFNGITSQHGAHFILKIDNILMKPQYCDAIINGVSSRNFPNVPVDYGYRDNKNFWYSKFKRPVAEPIPASKGISLDTVKYAASRLDPEVKFTDEACAKLVKVPRVFLNTVLKGCVAWAKENNVKLITEKEMEIIQDKRNKEKK